MRTNSLNEHGFTLAEVLVTVAIIAIMAAVILPALNNQLSKGDTARTVSDLTNVQSGVQAFVADLSHYPASTTQLISGATGKDINGAAFTASDAASWKGPYLSRDVLSRTGGRASIASAFTITTQSSTPFLTASLTPLTQTQFENLEGTLDEGTPTGTSSTIGVIRYSAPSSTVMYLVMPIR